MHFCRSTVINIISCFQCCYIFSFVSTYLLLLLAHFARQAISENYCHWHIFEICVVNNKMSSDFTQDFDVFSLNSSVAIKCSYECTWLLFWTILPLLQINNMDVAPSMLSKPVPSFTLEESQCCKPDVKWTEVYFSLSTSSGKTGVEQAKGGDTWQ